MEDHFQIQNVLPAYRDEFESNLKGRIGMIDGDIEGYSDNNRQRDFSVKFSWGHNHNFGDFSLEGQMGYRHLAILAEFMDNFGLPEDLHGKKILDIGVWTGGTCLLLSALGAEVVALEEVKKYADTVDYLAAAFGIENLTCRPMSLYDLDDHDEYDYVIYSGVIYHVTDPVLSLRILFNSLKDGGSIFVETYGVSSDQTSPPAAMIEGPMITGGGDESAVNRDGWNYFVPTSSGLSIWMGSVGFEDITVGNVDQTHRIKASGRRNTHIEMARAGLSRPDIR